MKVHNQRVNEETIFESQYKLTSSTEYVAFGVKPNQFCKKRKPPKISKKQEKQKETKKEQPFILNFNEEYILLMERNIPQLRENISFVLEK